ncbi:hypothetical protein ACFQ0P_15815 [Microbacterium insulae]|uniref:Uncharacterized protein n=1 Tax=Microbacterium insulae TaxID=483014 RepID=A0ABW3ALG7_9MICO
MTELHLESIAAERVDVGDGISIAAGWDAVVMGEASIPGAVRIAVRYDRDLRRVVAASVRVDRSDEGDEVTALTLRAVRVQAVVAASAMRLVTVARDGADAKSLDDYRADIHAAEERTTAEAITEAVVLYRIAFTVSLPPLRFVADELEVSVSTATRMMAKARQQGLATDLITRETYNRMQEEQNRMSAPHQLGGASTGPVIGR